MLKLTVEYRNNILRISILNEYAQKQIYPQVIQGLYIHLSPGYLRYG